jgi:hypothetical protein
MSSISEPAISSLFGRGFCGLERSITGGAAPLIIAAGLGRGELVKGSEMYDIVS